MENKDPNTQVAPKEGPDSPHAQSDSSGAEAGSLAFLKSLAEVSSVSVGFAFVVGWSYLASYYRTFGLNPMELDLPLPVVCTTAVYVLYSAAWPWLLAAWPWLLLVVALSFGWLFFGRHLQFLRRHITAVFLAILLFAASFASVSLGRRYANEDMLIDSSELPDVAFSSKLAKTDQPSCVDHETYGSADCKLLLHSKGTYYFFAPIPKSKDALLGVGSLNVYALADSDVTGVHILRGLQRNAGEK
jgi:hypothetical protein